jgi:hypothetical protein
MAGPHAPLLVAAEGGGGPAVQVQKCIKPPPLPTVCDIVQLRLL